MTLALAFYAFGFFIFGGAMLLCFVEGDDPVLASVVAACLIALAWPFFIGREIVSVLLTRRKQQ